MALSTGIVAAFKLENTTEEVAAANLTNNGVVTFIAGKFNNGAYVLTSGQYLSVASVFGLTSTSDFSISFWVNMAAEIADDRDFFNIVWTGATGAGIRIVYEYNGGTRRLRAYRDPNSAFADVSGNIADGTYKHILLTWTNSANQLKLYINNGTPGTGNSTGTTNPGAATQFNLGGTSQYSFTKPITGVIDDCVIWNKVLDSTERGQLYNGGTGLAYPFAAGATVVPTLMMLGVGS